VTKLYEKFTHGDRRTVVKKYKAGTAISSGTTALVLKKHCAVKITQECMVSTGLVKWVDVEWDLDNAVELSEDPSLPEPTSIPKMPVAGPGRPYGDTRSLFERIFGKGTR
jgi:hypothetical protein